MGLVAVIAAACATSTDGGASAGEPRPSTAAHDDAQLAGYTREPIVEVGDLTLTDFAADRDGEPFRFRAQQHGLLLVYFGYLSCPDVCPLTMVHVRDALAELDPELAARVSVAMVTVDPERDEGPEVATYLDHFFDDYAALRTTDSAVLEQVGTRFRARWEIEEHQPGEHYDVAHTAATYAIDDHGRIVREFPFGTKAGPLARSLGTLLQSGPPPPA